MEKIIVSFVGSNKRYKREMQTRFRATYVSGLFAFLGLGFAQIFAGQIVSVRVKTLSNTNLVASKYVRTEKASALVDLRRSAATVFSLQTNSSTFNGCEIHAETTLLRLSLFTKNVKGLNSLKSS